MVGYTFRALLNLLPVGADITNETTNGCRPEGDFHVPLKLYDGANKKVVPRQVEHSEPYALYGNKAPVPCGSPGLMEYGSALVPNRSTRHFAYGTQSDFGTNLLVVPC
jgi:hypothetical protein